MLRLEGAVLASILGPHFLIFVTALHICHQSEGLGLCRQQPQGLPDPQAGSPQVLTPEFGAVSNGWTRKPVRSPPCHCEPRKPSSSLAGSPPHLSQEAVFSVEEGRPDSHGIVLQAVFRILCGVLAMERLIRKLGYP